MDIKSKNIRYSLGLKIIAVAMMWVSVIGMLGSGVFLINNADKIRTSSYYDTDEYQWEISRLIHNVLELSTRLISEDHIRNSVVSTKASENIATDEFTKEKIITQEETVTQELEEETDITEEITESILHDRTINVKEATVNEKLERLARIRNNLARAVNFNYYIRDTQTGKVLTNIDSNIPDEIKNQPNSLYMNMYDIPYYLNYYDDIRKMLTEKPQEVYVSIEPLEPGDVFYDTYSSYTRAKQLAPYAIGTFVGTVIVLMGSFVYLVWVCGRKEKDGEIVLMGIDKIYNDVQSLSVLFAAALSLKIVSRMNFRNFNETLILVFVVLSIDILIGMTYFFSMLRQYKKDILLKNTLLYKILKKIVTVIRMCFNQKIFKGWVIGCLLLYGLINGILFGIAFNSRSSAVLFVTLLIMIFNGIAIYFIIKELASLTHIMKATKEISVGNLDYQLNESEISMEFLSFAKDIQSIQGGLKKAVNQAIKGERMKTDLITNVSHDLKTPLTSIINYVDLLKQEKLDNQKADEYVQILQEKSERLKQLIEDLIEASKASSGNLTINKGQVDLHELVIQACGEYEEKIQKAQLDIRINNPEKRVFVFADGKYMWRIIENLMSNVLKYSMPHSRVYIHIEQNNGNGLLVIKNISRYPLEIDSSQLTERFIRGDQSRTTEGSGLGLCIAQSLTDMQGGKFSIDIDGDLFKAIVEIPLFSERIDIQ